MPPKGAALRDLVLIKQWFMRSNAACRTSTEAELQHNKEVQRAKKRGSGRQKALQQHKCNSSMHARLGNCRLKVQEKQKHWGEPGSLN